LRGVVKAADLRRRAPISLKPAARGRRPVFRIAVETLFRRAIAFSDVVF
jgi:hypothetical protein